jgi:hypothetical protein
MTKSTKSRAKLPKHVGPKDKATEHYHREKARRAVRVASESDAMAAARREYLALLESDAAKGKGGRPRKKTAPVVAEAASESDEDGAEN